MEYSEYSKLEHKGISKTYMQRAELLVIDKEQKVLPVQDRMQQLWLPGDYAHKNGSKLEEAIITAVAGTKEILRMTAQVRSNDLIPEAIDAVEARLLRKLDDEDFSVFDQSEILDVISEILGALTAGLGGIAAISLVVGGIGIMNIMLVSVTERTREIGLRKALGATPSNIRTQFLIESVVLAVVGGAIGVALASGGALAINSFLIPSSCALCPSSRSSVSAM